MKKILILAAAMLLTINVFAETIPANDSRVVYVGRTCNLSPRIYQENIPY